MPTKRWVKEQAETTLSAMATFLLKMLLSREWKRVVLTGNKFALVQLMMKTPIVENSMNHQTAIA